MRFKGDWTPQSSAENMTIDDAKKGLHESHVG